MEEGHRQRAIRTRLARPASPSPVPLETGFAALDAATGGLPRGRFTEIFGGPGSGKTTLALQIAARAQKTSAVAWIDADAAFDPAYSASLGVDVEKLAVARPRSAEEAFEIVRRLALSRALDLIVIDSAAALTPEVELQTGIGKSGPGAQSRAFASGLRRSGAALRLAATAALVLNQTRASAGGEKSAGGAPLKLAAAVRIALYPSGTGARFRVLKSHAGGAFLEGLLRWEAGRGFTESP
jgi:recombination protein RecA